MPSKYVTDCGSASLENAPYVANPAAIPPIWLGRVSVCVFDNNTNPLGQQLCRAEDDDDGQSHRVTLSVGFDTHVPPSTHVPQRSPQLKPEYPFTHKAQSLGHLLQSESGQSGQTDVPDKRRCCRILSTPANSNGKLILDAGDAQSLTRILDTSPPLTVDLDAREMVPRARSSRRHHRRRNILHVLPDCYTSYNRPRTRLHIPNRRSARASPYESMWSLTR